MRGTIRTLCVDVFILSLSCSGLWAQQQTVAPTPTSQTADTGTAVSFDAIYDTSNGDATVTGLGLRMHFDSSALTFNSRPCSALVSSLSKHLRRMAPILTKMPAPISLS